MNRVLSNEKAKETPDQTMRFVGDMLNKAFLTEKGKTIFDIFYKSTKLPKRMQSQT